MFRPGTSLTVNVPVKSQAYKLTPLMPDDILSEGGNDIIIRGNRSSPVTAAFLEFAIKYSDMSKPE